MTSRSSSVPLIARPGNYRPLSRPSRSDLYCLQISSLHLFGSPLSSMSLVASSPHNLSFSSSSIVLPPLIIHLSVNVLEHEPAALPMQSITSDVLPVLFLPGATSLCVVLDNSPHLSDFHDGDCPPGWKSYLGDLNSWVLKILPRSLIPPVNDFIGIPTAKTLSFQPISDTRTSPMLGFQYAPRFLHELDVCQFD